MRNSSNKILITAVGGDIGQSVISALLETEYAELLCGCDINRYSAGRALLKTFFPVPELVGNEKGYRGGIRKIVKKYGIKFILPLSEKEIGHFSEYEEYYEKIGVKVLILKRDILEICFDKYKTIRYLADNGFYVPATYTVEDYPGEFKYPIILKKRASCGGKGVIIVQDEEELVFYLKRNPDIIVQENIGSIDQEYTVGVFSDGKNVFSIAFQRYLGYGGMTKHAKLVHDKKLLKQAEKIARLFRLKGSMNIQFRKSGNKYVPFEINPRISGTVYFRHHFGFKDVKWWLDVLFGKKIYYIDRKKIKGVAVRSIGSVFFND